MMTVPNDCKVFTPAPLADAMAAVLPNRPGDHWLEPCVGGGVFLAALARQGVLQGQVTAVELDLHNELADQCGTYHPGVDFLGWSLRTAGRFDRIVGNPPYLPLHRVPEAVRAAALCIPRPSGGYVPRKANCWYAFLCASLRLLKPDGGICFVLPSAWEYADYAADLRGFVLTRFAKVEVYRSETSVFNGVLDGCVVLAADGFETPNASVERRTHRTGDELIEGLHLPLSKATTGLLPRANSQSAQDCGKLVRFGDICQVRIGGVTGDVDYFLMTEVRRRSLGLNRDHVLPVLTRARHLTQAFQSQANWRMLRDAGERVWLFWPKHDEGHPPAVADYLRLGENLGIPDRTKVQARAPWFRTRLPPRPDGVLSGMTPHGPWVSLVRMAGLFATNTLYTVHFRQRLTHAQQAAWSLALLSAHTIAQHAYLGRRYSDGLLKFEPQDVMNLVVPVPSMTTSNAPLIYQKAVASLLQGNSFRAIKLVETFLAKK
jgi:adenine-specific DNA-methyltransferase